MNANKIRAKIVEQGMTQGEVAKIIGISPNSFSRKLLGKRDFLLSEVIALCSVLDLDKPEEIFWTKNPKCATYETNHGPARSPELNENDPDLHDRLGVVSLHTPAPLRVSLGAGTATASR